MDFGLTRLNWPSTKTRSDTHYLPNVCSRRKQRITLMTLIIYINEHILFIYELLSCAFRYAKVEKRTFVGNHRQMNHG